MKFLHKDAKRKQITENIILDEYCESVSNLSLDGAYAQINGSLGPKINKTFSELFFVITGKLELEIDGVVHVLNEKDMYIIPPNTKHKMLGEQCEVFISCSPQFNIKDVEMCKDVEMSD